MKEILSALIAVVWMIGLVSGCGTNGDMGSSSASVSGKDANAEQASGPCGILQNGAVNTGTLPEGCAKIEGDQIGEEDVKLTVNGIEVTFTSWKSKDGEEGDFIGFDYVSTAAVCVSVKASTERFVATEAGTWTYPASAGKPHGISNVVVCQPVEEPESNPGTDPDNASSGADSPDGSTGDGSGGTGAGTDPDNASGGADPSGGSTGDGAGGTSAGTDPDNTSGGADSGSSSSDPTWIPEM